MRSNQDDEYFCDGLAKDLLNALAKTPLFAEILPDMNDEERAILESTSTFANLPKT